MLLFDIVNILIELVKNFFSVLGERVPRIEQFNHDVLVWYYNLWEGTIYYLYSHVPIIYFVYIRMFFERFRTLTLWRFLTTWLPINPYGTVLEVLLRPVDLIIRPLTWYLPKIPYIDLSGWFPFIVFDAIIDICTVIEGLGTID
jgi:hypothetical protein